MQLIKYLLLLLFSISAFAQVDGPALLPLTTPRTSLSSPNTPKIVVGDLQTALNSTVPGDMLIVDKYSGPFGQLTMPYGCDSTGGTDGVGITIMTNELLPVGRLEPLVNPLLAYPTVNLAGSDSVWLNSCIQLIGFQIESDGAPITYNLVRFKPGSHDVVLDRNWLHGTKNQETTRGIELAGSYGVTISDNYLNDFACTASTGACTDSQAINGGIGSGTNDGNYLIINNYLEAAGQSILFGGDAAAGTPTNITIMLNTLAKNPCWNPNNSCYDKRLRIVKNSIEFKNADRVLADKNVFVWTWGGFSQNGSMALFTAKNPGGCSVCKVTNITLRNSRFEYGAAALQLANALSDTGLAAAAGNNWSIHDNQFVHLQYSTCYKCTANFLIQIGTSLSPLVPPLTGVSIRYNTFMVDGWLNQYHGLLQIGGLPGSQSGIEFSDNVVPQGWALLYSAGGDASASGTASCAYQVVFQSISQALNNCWGNNYKFVGNVILNTGEKGGIAPASTIPAGNFLVNAGYNPYLQP